MTTHDAVPPQCCNRRVLGVAALACLLPLLALVLHRRLGPTQRWLLQWRQRELGSGAIVNVDYPRAVPGAKPTPDVPAVAAALWAKYQQRLRAHGASNITIVYDCGSTAKACHGWADRIQGMATVFYYALLTDSQFDIADIRPLDLASVYPLIAQRRPLYNSSQGQTVGWINRNKVFLLSLDVRSHVRRHRVHLVRTNRPHWYFLLLNPHLSEAVSFYQLDKLTNIDMFRVFVELYISQRSPELQQRVDAQAAAIAGGNPRPLLVGVQIRTGGDGGWGDPRRHPPESAVQFAEQSLRVCKQVDNRCAIYVTSDSLTAQGTFVEHVKRQAPNVSVTVAGGEPVHLDKSAIPANDTSTLLKSFVDYEMLRRMDHLVISRSGFGETAAWAGAIPTDQLKLPPRARPPPPGSAPFNASFFAYDSVVGPDVPKQIQLMHASGQPISFPAYDSELVPPPPSSPPAPAPAPL